MIDLRRINYRALLAFGHDIVAVALAWMLAYWLRFNLDIQEPFLASMFNTLLWVIPVQALFFWTFGLYRGIWRYASLPDLKRILRAVAVAALVTPAVLFMFRAESVVPRSVLLLHPILQIMIMGGSRIAYRAWKEHRLYGVNHKKGEAVVIIGSGDAAVSLVKELERSEHWKIIGLLDDNPAKHGRMIHSVQVLGPLASLPHWVNARGARHAIIAMPTASHNERHHAVNVCNAAGVRVLTVPSYADLMSGRFTVSQVRSVEVDDLLGRDPVVLDNDGLHRTLTDRVVMVTGAGGSIGAELCRQIAAYSPRLLVLYELNEYALYNVEQEFSEKYRHIPMLFAIGDVKDAPRLAQVMRQYAPSVVFHAAAYKHVPLMEVGNAWQAVLNNVLGTYTVAQVAIRQQVEKFVLISTDKAVNPTNVMGASKRLAEMVCQGLQAGTSETRFVMVRFGNVLGSAGSVIPKFQEQIRRGGPVTVTHPEITRYFMSIPEASQLVLQAGLMGQGGEIFVMDMGDPVKIIDLARDMIRLSGFSEAEIGIVFTGLRPGEKLYEELLANDEHTLETPHPKLRIARARSMSPIWVDQLLTWLMQSRELEDEAVRAGLKTWLESYSEAEAGVPTPTQNLLADQLEP